MALNKVNFSISRDAMSAIFIIAVVSLWILSNFFAGFIFPVYIVAMTIAFIISITNPKSGILASIFLIMVFERFFTLSSLFIGKVEYKLFPVDIILIGIMIRLTFKYIGKLKTIKLKTADKWLIVFILVNILYFLASFFISSADIALSFSTLKNYAFYSLVYFITLLAIESREDILRIFRFFLAGGIAIIFFIIFGAINGGGLWTEFTPLTTSGVRILAFTHGLYLSLIIIPTILYVVFNKAKLKSKNFLFYLLILVWTVGIVGSLMRHLWVALVISLTFVYFLLPKDKKNNFKKLAPQIIFPSLAVGVAVLYLFILFPTSDLSQKAVGAGQAVVERGASIAGANQDDSFLWREMVWNGAFGEYKNNPLLGIGTGKEIYVENATYRDYVEIRNIHNSYLSVFMQLGILGIGSLLIFIFLTVKALWKTKTKDEKFAFMKYSLLGTIFVYLAAFSFQPYLETNLLAIFFWMSLGLSRKLIDIHSYIRSDS